MGEARQKKLEREASARAAFAPAPSKPITIHFKSVFDGKADEAVYVHRKLAWGGRRCICGSAPVIRIQAFMPKVEMLKLSPGYMGMLMATGKYKELQSTKYGILIPYADVVACATCRQTAEREAAKLPSYVVVDIDRGPGADKPLVAVG